LPPVFVAAGLSIFAAPLLEKRKQPVAHETLTISSLQTAAADSRQS
jgi:hypothetical protein